MRCDGHKKRKREINVETLNAWSHIVPSHKWCELRTTTNKSCDLWIRNARARSHPHMLSDWQIKKSNREKTERKSIRCRITCEKLFHRRPKPFRFLRVCRDICAAHFQRKYISIFMRATSFRFLFFLWSEFVAFIISKITMSRTHIVAHTHTWLNSIHLRKIRWWRGVDSTSTKSNENSSSCVHVLRIRREWAKLQYLYLFVSSSVRRVQRCDRQSIYCAMSPGCHFRGLYDGIARDINDSYFFFLRWLIMLCFPMWFQVRSACVAHFRHFAVSANRKHSVLDSISLLIALAQKR